MTIQALLTLLQEWRDQDLLAGSPLEAVDIPALRLQCQQHAEQLRTLHSSSIGMIRIRAHEVADFLSQVNRGTR